MAGEVNGQPRDANQCVGESRHVRRWPPAEAPEEPGSLDLREHGQTLGQGQRTAPYGNVVVDLHHQLLTIVEAHPYHRYILDDRPGGNAIVERAYEARCPRCRDDDSVAKRARPA